MSIRLFTSYYTDKDPARQMELDQCLKNNMECTSIDEIYIICEDLAAYLRIWNKRVKKILIHDRPTFNVLFDVINGYNPGPDAVSIISNSDIFFDESIKQVEGRITARQAYALTRWDNDNPEKEYRHIKRVDSQDAWIFRGPVQPVNGDFCMGVCGCDNTLAHRLHIAGYQVSNPSLTIKSFHLHSTGIRSYDVNVKTPQPYKTLQATI